MDVTVFNVDLFSIQDRCKLFFCSHRDNQITLSMVYKTEELIPEAYLGFHQTINNHAEKIRLT